MGKAPVIGLVLGAVLVLGFVLWRVLLLPAVGRAVLLSPLARPIILGGLQDDLDTGMHEKYFLQLVRAHQYAQARALLTPEAQKAVPTATLAAQWAVFERAHGRVTRWMEVGGTDSLLPQYVEHRLRVSGTRGAGTAVLRFTQSAPGQPPPGDWRIARATVTP